MRSDARWVRLSRQASLLVAPSGLHYEAECARLAYLEGIVWDETDEDIVQILNDITARAVSTHLLLDWSGIKLHGISNTTYTPERGYEALRSAPKFLSVVLQAADDLAKGLDKITEQTTSALEWQLKWGGGLEALRLSYKRTGVPPKALLNQPDFTRDVRFYLDCFRQLNGYRGGSGFGANPLGFSDTAALADELGYAKGTPAFLFFMDMMSSLDAAFMKHHREQSETKPPASKHKTRR